MKEIGNAILLSFLAGIFAYIIINDFYTALTIGLTSLLISYILIIIYISKGQDYKKQIKDMESEIKIKNRALKKMKYQLETRSEIEIGLLQISRSGDIEYANEYFYSDIYEAEIRHYLEFENIELFNIIVEAINGKKSLENIRVGSKYFAVKYKRVGKKGLDLLFQFYDVTKEETLDKLHNNFLVDASHELNNPLSSIMMASDIINRETPSEFSKILVKESKRMNEVISGIIEQSKIQGKTKFKMGEVNLSELILGYEGVYQTKRELKLNVEEAIMIEGNIKLLDRMFKNLIDNALKYSEDIVEIKLYTKDNIYVKIKDSGEGIDSNNFDLIFKRFYREDKSRSRDTGGMGIGLSIVAEIAKVHDIEILVDSEIGSGTTFTLIFKSV